MLTNGQLVKALLNKSIVAAYDVFCHEGTDDYNRVTAKFRELQPLDEEVFDADPALGDSASITIKKLAVEPTLDSEHLSAQVRIIDGQADIFIPTGTIVETIRQVSFFLNSHTSVLLVGERGCGKSLILNKVVPTLARGTTVKYLIMGNSIANSGLF